MSEYAKKLHIRRNGIVTDIKLYTTTSDVRANYLSLRDGTTTVYAKLGSTNDANASALRVRKSGIVYSVLTLAGAAPRRLAACSDFTVAVQSNGTVKSNLADVNTATNSWTNIKAISLYMPSTASGWLLYGIKNDGTVVKAGSYTPAYNSTVVAWTNVVDIQCDDSGVAIGLKSDGTIVYTSSPPIIGSVAFNAADWVNLKQISKTPIDINTGDYQMLGLKNDGTVIFAGEPYTTGVNNVSALTGISSLACGNLLEMFLKSDGTATSKGNVGTVTSWTNIKQVSCAGFTCFVLKNDGTVASNSGSLHIGAGLDTSSLSNVAEIYSFEDACAYDDLAYLKNDGTVGTLGVTQTSLTIT